jgi:hypothetical protein
MVYNALPTYVHTIIATSDYKWYDKNKLDAEVCAYFECLIVISALARGEKWEPKSTSKKKVIYTGKKNAFSNPKTRPSVSSANSLL